MLYLTKKAGGKINVYSLVKLMYFADKAHLHKKGHTITGDCYARMPRGSTGPQTYDMVKEARGDESFHPEFRAFVEPHPIGS